MMNFKKLQKEIDSISYQNIIFIGLGNPIRGDDGAGLELIEQLEKRHTFQGAHFIKGHTTPENYLVKITQQNPELVVFVDTARMNKKPGDISEIQSDLIDSKGFSTHTYSMKLIEDYLTSNGVSKIKYIGIEPKTTEISNTISAEVQEGINRFFN